MLFPLRLILTSAYTWMLLVVVFDTGRAISPWISSATHQELSCCGPPSRLFLSILWLPIPLLHPRVRGMFDWRPSIELLLWWFFPRYPRPQRVFLVSFCSDFFASLSFRCKKSSRLKAASQHHRTRVSRRPPLRCGLFRLLKRLRAFVQTFTAPSVANDTGNHSWLA